MSDPVPLEHAAEALIRDYVLHRAELGVYDATRTRRPRADVLAFAVELIEFDPAEMTPGPVTPAVLHAAGPVRLRTAQGDVDRHLHASLAVEVSGDSCRLQPEPAFRAVFIEDVGNPNGGCKEILALANAPREFAAA